MKLIKLILIAVVFITLLIQCSEIQENKKNIIKNLKINEKVTDSLIIFDLLKNSIVFEKTNNYTIYKYSYYQPCKPKSFVLINYIYLITIDSNDILKNVKLLDIIY